MKKCGYCKQIKPREGFYKNRGHKDGYCSVCKECNKNYSAQYYIKNKEKIKEKSQEYHKKYYKKFRERHLLNSKKLAQKLKKEIFQHYGLRCVCCGESNIQFLTIDHINNDGGKHRKELGLKTIYRWLKKSSYPKGFQTLCYNCNLGKAANGGICPHKTGK